MLLHKPPILLVAIEGAGEAVGEGRGIERSREERINITRLVRAREEVINFPQVDRTILCAREILVSVVGSCNRIDMTIRKLH